MPYRVEFGPASSLEIEQLIDLGALDVEAGPAGRLVAIMPDSVTPDALRSSLAREDLLISQAVSRDDGSVWVVAPRPIQAGGLVIVPAGSQVPDRGLALHDRGVFGTGLHPTTALCLEALGDLVPPQPPATAVDIGTGSGVLALAALRMGVPRVVAVDTDDASVAAARENARLNQLDDRLDVRPGGPDAAPGAWPLVIANILAAPLIEMAPALVRLVGGSGDVLLSGIPESALPEVEAAYRRLGLRHRDARSRGGWAALVMRASW